MGTLDDLKKMTGNDDVYQSSSGKQGGGNSVPVKNNLPDGGKGGPATGTTDGASASGGVPDAHAGTGGGTTGSTKNSGGTGKQPEDGEALFDRKIKDVNEETLRHLREKRRGIQGIDSTLPDSGVLPEVNVAAAEKKAKPGKEQPAGGAQVYERKAAAAAGRLENWKPSTEAPKYEDIPEPPKRNMSMKEMYEKLNPGMSEEEIKKKERGMRIERLFNAIGDGISAIAALNATKKGALNTFFAKDSLSARQQKRMDEWKKKVEAYRKGLYEAQMQDAENAEKDYKARLEYVKAKNGLEGKLADFNLKLENLGRQGQKDAMNAYIALMQKEMTQTQFKERMEELKRHNKEMEDLGAGRLGVAKENAATSRARQERQAGKDDREESTRHETYVNPKTGERTVLDTKAKDYYGQKRKLSQEYGDVYRDQLHDKKGRNTGKSRVNTNPSNARVDAVMARHRVDGPGGIDPKYLPKGKTTGVKLGVKW